MKASKYKSKVTETTPSIILINVNGLNSPIKGKLRLNLKTII